MSEENEITNWQEFFENFKYKPNFRFEYIYDPDFKMSKVRVRMIVPNSRELGYVRNNTTVTSTFVLPKWVSKGYACDEIRHYLIEMEKHEVDEWFRLDGELVFDPHREDACT